jgi:hypothetical protein
LAILIDRISSIFLIVRLKAFASFISLTLTSIWKIGIKEKLDKERRLSKVKRYWQMSEKETNNKRT